MRAAGLPTLTVGHYAQSGSIGESTNCSLRASGLVVDERHTDMLVRILPLMHADVRDDEDVLVPSLHQLLGANTLRKLGRTWKVAGSPQRRARIPPSNFVCQATILRRCP